MKIKLLESSFGTGPHQQILASYIVNDSTVIDAGSIGFVTPLDVQKRVRHLLLSHSHIDHLASLPIFVDNIYQPGPDCVRIYASEDVQACLQSDIFNDRIWPDMIRLSEEESPFLAIETICSEEPVELEGLEITPIQLNHIVPTLGFLIDDGDVAIAIISDTSPTERVWELLNQCDRLAAVFLEASFPNDMDWLADRAMHLTPSLFESELRKLQQDAQIIAVHIKPAYDERIRQELAALGHPRLEIGEPGRTYEF